MSCNNGVQIPREVLDDYQLTDGAKLLYGEILSICEKTGYCEKTNGYFQNLSGHCERAVQNYLNSLEERGYIRHENIYYDGSDIVKNRKIYVKHIITTLSGTDICNLGQ